MNKITILTKLAKPKIWTRTSIIIIAIFVIVRLIFNITAFLLNDSVDLQKDINVAKEELKLINRRSAQLFALERKLPKLTDQLELAKVYFESYALLFDEIAGKRRRNKQKVKITGTIQSMVLAIYYAKKSAILLHYNNLTVNNNKAILNITIYGARNG